MIKKDVVHILVTLIILYELTALANNFTASQRDFKKYATSLNITDCYRDDVEIIYEDWYCPHCFYKLNHSVFFDPHKDYISNTKFMPEILRDLYNLITSFDV